MVADDPTPACHPCLQSCGLSPWSPTVSCSQRFSAVEACLMLRKLRPLGLIAGLLLGLSVSMSAAGKVAGSGRWSAAPAAVRAD